MIYNTPPRVPTLQKFEVGFTKALASFNTPSESDARGIIGFQDSTEFLRTSNFPATNILLESLPSSWVLSAVVYDSLVEGTAIVADLASVNSSQLNVHSENVSMLPDVVILGLDVITSVSTGYETVPSFIEVTFNSGTPVTIEANSAGAGWVSVGTYTPDEDNKVTIPSPNLGETFVRAKGLATFSNGVTDIQPTWSTFGSSVNVELGVTPPNEPSNFQTEFLRIKNGLLERADLKVSFDWESTGATAREFKLSWSEITDINGVSNGNASDINDASTVTTWENEVSLGISTEYYLSNVKPGLSGTTGGVKYAFRVQAVGWDEQASSSYIYGLAQISRNQFEALTIQGPVTNITMTDYHIRGSNGGTQTFLLNGVDGSLSLGANSEISLNSSGVVTVKGSVITDQIESADFVMSWLSGVAPSLHTSNKTSYTDNDPGIWMGYTDTQTFRMYLGNANNYVKWSGSDLSIKGDLQLGKTSFNDASTGIWMSDTGTINIGNNSNGKFFRFDGTKFEVGPWVEIGTEEHRDVTVGASGQYGTIKEALESVSKTLISYNSSGNSATITVIDATHYEGSGIYLENIDLSWITIRSGGRVNFSANSNYFLDLNNATGPNVEISEINASSGSHGVLRLQNNSRLSLTTSNPTTLYRGLSSSNPTVLVTKNSELYVEDSLVVNTSPSPCVEISNGSKLYCDEIFATYYGTVRDAGGAILVEDNSSLVATSGIDAITSGSSSKDMPMYVVDGSSVYSQFGSMNCYNTGSSAVDFGLAIARNSKVYAGSINVTNFSTSAIRAIGASELNISNAFNYSSSFSFSYALEALTASTIRTMSDYPCNISPRTFSSDGSLYMT